jgi:hypothetical protein
MSAGAIWWLIKRRRDEEEQEERRRRYHENTEQVQSIPSAYRQEPINKMTKQTTLKEENLALMNLYQRMMVLAQWQKHQHDDFECDYDVSGEGDNLEGFVVKKGVWNPFLASGRYHARYLFYHNELFKGKTAIEIGSGTGLMGVVMAKYGADKVVMSDAVLHNSFEVLTV